MPPKRSAKNLGAGRRTKQNKSCKISNQDENDTSAQSDNPVKSETMEPKAETKIDGDATDADAKPAVNGTKRKSPEPVLEGEVSGEPDSEPAKKSPKLDDVEQDEVASSQKLEQNEVKDPERYWNRDPLSPLRDDDKQRWPGFREIETDADEFESMLRMLGAKDLAVRHVFSLDIEDLSFLPQPIVGFVFCFRHRSDDETNQVESCPDNIWFANQTHRWLCGSNSIINILMNIPNLDLGEHLNAFKDFTRDFTPAQRGEAVGNYDFLRQIHNSCLRKMEILLGDVALMEEYNNRKPIKKPTVSEEKPAPTGKGKGKGKGKAKPPPKKKTVTEEDEIDDDAAYHYAAYLPMHGHIWKLDGLDRQPSKLDACGNDDWMEITANILRDRMMEVDADETACSILAISRQEDPLPSLRAELAGTVTKLTMILDALSSSSEINAEDKERSKIIIKGPDKELGLTQALIDEAADLPEEVTNALTGGDIKRMRALRDEILTDQQRAKGQIEAEKKSQEGEQVRMHVARHDYEPLVRTWLEMLANKDGVVRGLVEELSG